MSRRPIARSADLRRLRDEGYDLDIREGHLLVRDVPYLNACRELLRGTLVSPLDLAGDVTVRPSRHVAYWIGQYPCHGDGRRIAAFENTSAPPVIADDVRPDFFFSALAQYRDYHHKVTTYVGRIVAEAASVHPGVTAQTYPAIQADDAEEIFKYVDTASSRAGITALNARFIGQRIGIVGLGGTGSFVLDLVAKTPVAEIHLFDGDVFSQHNAFRAPGAATMDQLRGRPQKVDHHAATYSHLRHCIVPHDVKIDDTNVGLLDGLSFVFVCVDKAEPKRVVVRHLEAAATPFVDVGMGLLMDEEGISGLVRSTMSTAGTREAARPHISFADADAVPDEYATNIQVADLNALNATFAVIRWKQWCGFYKDLRQNFYIGFSVATGEVVAEGLR